MILISWTHERTKRKKNTHKTQESCINLKKKEKKKKTSKGDYSESALLNVFMQTALINLIQTWIFL